MNNAIIIGSIDNAQNQTNQNGDNINYIKATECEYRNYLAENEQIIYEKFLNKGCCGSGNNKMAVTLLVYSIIIIIFVVAGYIFRISNNEGYKEYKKSLENLLQLVDTNLPDESEMQKVLNFSNILKEYRQSNNISDDSDSNNNYNGYNDYNYYDDYDYYNYNIDDYYRNYNNYYNRFVENCSYEYFRLGICSWKSYKNYCNYTRYINNTCNLIDLRVYYRGVFNCTYEDYSQHYCSYQQYIDNKTGYLDKFIYYGGKPKRIDIRVSDYYDDDRIFIKNIYGTSYIKFWCDIGKYDTYLFIILALIMVIFIIFIIIDLCISKENISNGLFYYIILICYMIFYIIFRIFICLLFCLLIYSIVISSTSPEFEGEVSTTFNDEFINKNFYISYNNVPSMNIWEDKRIYSIINSCIVFFLFIFVSMLDGLKVVIINYLGLNFKDNKKYNEINRNISIRFGDENYEIEVKNKLNVYLDENISRRKIKFKEINIGKDNYFLKLSNKGLVDQIGFSEWNYPNINEGFSRLGGILDFIYVVLFLSVLSTKFEINQEYTYKFLIYAIDLGLSLKLNKYVKNYGYLEQSIINYRLYVYIILSITILLFMLKRAFFGGFKSNLLFWIFFIISLLFILFNLASFLLTILFNLYTWMTLSVFSSKIIFDNETLVILKLSIQGSLNILIFIMQIVIFGKSISYTIFLYSMKAENDKIGSENQNVDNNVNSSDKEEGFEFVGLDIKSHYFQAVNNTNLPKYLFYIKTEKSRREIFIPENPRITINQGNYNINYAIYQNNNNNNINNINNNNNINNINFKNKTEDNNYNHNYTSSEVLKLNNNNEITNQNNRVNANIIINNNDTGLEIDNNNNNNKDNISNEIICITNDNKRLRDENENLRQQIQSVKNKLGLMLNIQ